MYKNAYTGIDDIDGRRIYEGDTVYFEVFDGLVTAKAEAKVYFDGGCFRLNSKHPLIDYVRNGWVRVIE